MVSLFFRLRGDKILNMVIAVMILFFCFTKEEKNTSVRALVLGWCCGIKAEEAIRCLSHLCRE